MAKPELNAYIEKRYNKWMDYASYHAARAGISELAGDLLQEVVIMLLEKDEAFLLGLLAKQKGGYAELDFYALKLIKQNAHSPTSPFRYKEVKQRIDRNADAGSMDLCDDGADTTTYEEQLMRVEDVREAVNGIYIGGEAKCLFYHVFFDGGNIADFKSKRSKNELHSMYLRTLKMVRDSLCPELSADQSEQLNLFNT